MDSPACSRTWEGVRATLRSARPSCRCSESACRTQTVSPSERGPASPTRSTEWRNFWQMVSCFLWPLACRVMWDEVSFTRKGGVHWKDERNASQPLFEFACVKRENPVLKMACSPKLFACEQTLSLGKWHPWTVTRWRWVTPLRRRARLAMPGRSRHQTSMNHRCAIPQ